MTKKHSDPQRQTCKACGQPEKFDFVVTNEIWRMVVPEPYQNLALCLYCFDEFASEANVDYASALSAVYFAGDRGSFVFTIESAVNVSGSQVNGHEVVVG